MESGDGDLVSGRRRKVMKVKELIRGVNGRGCGGGRFLLTFLPSESVVGRVL